MATITGTANGDFLNGSEFNDLIDGLDGNDTIFAGAGRDVVRGGIGNDFIVDDNIDGPFSSDRLFGQNGDDTIKSNGGADVINGGAGFDTAWIDRQYATVNLRFVMSADPAVATVLKGDGTTVTSIDAVRLTGGFNHDVFATLSGNDTLDGGGGNDRLWSGAGHDSLFGGNGEDRLAGGSDNDSVNGSDGDDTLLGGGGNDYLFDSGFNDDEDALLGGNGQDTLEGGRGNDVLDGGAGDDSLEDEAILTILTPSNDTLMGGSGNDSITSRRGSDIIDGGAGLDAAAISRIHAGALTFLMTDTGTVTTLVGDGTTVVNVENIYLNGGGSGDHFRTLDGSDRLYGDSGNDILEAGGGDDLLYGYYGADRLQGDAGNDTFLYTRIEESGTTAATRDRIVDFTPLADKIDVSAFALPFTFIGTAAFTAAGQIRAVQTGADTLLEFNTSGVDGAEMTILLANVTATSLSAADFVL